VFAITGGVLSIVAYRNAAEFLQITRLFVTLEVHALRLTNVNVEMVISDRYARILLLLSLALVKQLMIHKYAVSMVSVAHWITVLALPDTLRQYVIFLYATE
jgi:hypothetical protein